jgi:GNAT superfamily N-acetyltransferase
LITYAPTIEVVNTRPEHLQALEDNQRIIYPTLTDDELFTAEKYLSHLALFRQGQFVALAHFEGQTRVAGCSSTFRTFFDIDNDITLTYEQVIDGGWLSNHNPDGEWLYGADMCVHPDFRGMGVGRRLYEARRALVRRQNLRGEIAGGMLPGYHRYQKGLTVAQYVLRVTQGKLSDPTLSMQLKMGFRVRGLLYDHITDPRSQNTAALIIRENPEHRPPEWLYNADSYGWHTPHPSRLTRGVTNRIPTE